jgi:hypothetical protein
MAATMGLTAAAVARLRSHKTVALHFESENRPAIEAVN